MTRNKRDIDKELMYKKLMPSGAPDAEPEGAAVSRPRRRAQEPRKISVPALDNRQTRIVNVMPRYVVLPEDQAPPDIEPELNARVVAAMIQAVRRVRAKPRH